MNLPAEAPSTTLDPERTQRGAGHAGLAPAVQLGHAARLVDLVRQSLPGGSSLPESRWRRVHRVVLALLWAHVVVIPLFAMAHGNTLLHGLLEAVPVALAAAVASGPYRRRVCSVAATVGLLTSSAVLVHLSGGVIEAHFHFFVVLSVIALYNDWTSFLVAVGYVIAHHGVIGVLAPQNVYNHQAAWASPWKWAAIHGLFVLAASVSSLAAWRLTEAARTRAELILNSAGEGIFGLDDRGRAMFVNPAAARMVGWEVHELVGKVQHKIMHHSRPDGSPYPHESCPISAAFRDGATHRGTDEVFWRKDGTSFPVEYVSTPIHERGKVVGAVATFRDVTDMTWTNGLLAAEARILEGIARGDRFSETLDALVAMIEGHSEGAMCSILLLDEDGKTLRHASARSLPASYCEAIDGVEIGPAVGSCGTAAFKGTPIVVTDIATDPLWSDYRDLALEHGLRACWSIPIRTARTEKVLGTFAVYYAQPRAPSTRHWELIERSVHLAAIAIEGRAAEERLKDAERKYRGLVETVPAIVYTVGTGPKAAWDYISPDVETVLGFSAQEWMADPELWSKQLHSDDRDRVLAEHAERWDRATTERFSSEYRLLTRDGRAVWVRDDAVFMHGAAGAHHRKGMLFDITDQREAEADKAALEDRLRKELEDHFQELKEIHAVTDIILNAVDLQSALEGILDKAMALGAFDIGLIRLWDPLTRSLRAMADRGYRDPGAVNRHHRSTDSQDKRTFVRAMEMKETFVIDDLRATDRMRTLKAEGARTLVVVPVSANDEVLGMINIGTRECRKVPDRQLRVLEAIGSQMGIAVQKARLEDQLKHQAFHDPLTNLANRALFRDRVEHALARAQRSAGRTGVLFIDLDDFKRINDSFGHDIGDDLLVSVAERLLASLRPADTAARLGGDEFAVLLEDLTGTQDAIAVTERIIGSLQKPFEFQERELIIDSSIGIALADGRSADDLLRNADVAMYAAKAGGKGRYEVFESSMHTAVLERAELEGDLRKALVNHELTLYYQPIVSFETDTIAGVEALLRWNHPRRGMVQPLQFIPLAEQTGMIVPIGTWVLQRACTEVRSLQEQYPSAPPLTVSVNLSADQLLHPDMARTVEDALGESGLSPESLVLEITESVLMKDTDATIRKLEELKQLGVRLAIDDFGTGYSSLNYLRRFPLDILKIDKSFIDGVAGGSEESALARAIIKLGAMLGLDVVAEGIEEADQVESLKALDCTLGQGFHFSKPLPEDELRSFLSGSRPPGVELARTSV